MIIVLCQGSNIDRAVRKQVVARNLPAVVLGERVTAEEVLKLRLAVVHVHATLHAPIYAKNRPRQIEQHMFIIKTSYTIYRVWKGGWIYMCIYLTLLVMADAKRPIWP